MKYPALATLTAVCALFFGALAQNAPSPKPADPPAAEVTKPAKLTESEKKPVPEAVHDALYKAQHQHDQSQKQISDINMQFIQVQAQAKQQMDAAQAKDKEAQAALDKATAEAYKIAGLSQDEWKLDIDSMEFTQRQKPRSEPKK
jgi:hypothetical protein